MTYKKSPVRHLFCTSMLQHFQESVRGHHFAKETYTHQKRPTKRVLFDIYFVPPCYSTFKRAFVGIILQWKPIHIKRDQQKESYSTFILYPLVTALSRERSWASFCKRDLYTSEETYKRGQFDPHRACWSTNRKGCVGIRDIKRD